MKSQLNKKDKLFCTILVGGTLKNRFTGTGRENPKKTA